jgi:hypothetical protein
MVAGIDATRSAICASGPHLVARVREGQPGL